MVTSGSLGGVMFSPLAWNARDVGSIPSVETIFPIVITALHWHTGDVGSKVIKSRLSFG